MKKLLLGDMADVSNGERLDFVMRVLRGMEKGKCNEESLHG